MKAMIVKAQLSLNDGGQHVLIYNADRSITSQFPATQELIEAIGEDKKAFFFSVLRDDGILELGETAPWQEW